MSRSPLDDLRMFHEGWVRASAPRQSFAINVHQPSFGRLHNGLRFPLRRLAVAYAVVMRQRFVFEDDPAKTYIVGTADPANVTYAGGKLVLLPREDQGGE